MTHFHRSNLALSRRSFLGSAAIACACGSHLTRPQHVHGWHPDHTPETEIASRSPCGNAPTGEVPGPADGTKGAIDLARCWKVPTVRVKFATDQNSNWHKNIHSRICEIAPLWTNYAHLKFELDVTDNPDITINLEGLSELFDSQIGTDSKRYPQSMNLVFLETRKPQYEAESNRLYHYYILHEFGHALGFLHEHQRPQEIAWVTDKLLPYAEKKWSWTQTDVKTQIINGAMNATTVTTRLDPRSVMFYEFPAGIAYAPKPNTAPPEPDQQQPIVTSLEGQLSRYDKVLAATAYPSEQLSSETLVTGRPALTSKLKTPGATARFTFGNAVAGKYQFKYSGDMPALISLVNYPLNSSPRWRILEVYETPDGTPREIEFTLDHPGTTQLHVRHAAGRTVTSGEFQAALAKLT